jgi:glutamine cyclotransferase
MLCRVPVRFALALCATACIAGCPPSPPPTDATTYTYEVVNSYPHDTTAFTQGLFYHDGALYEGTGRTGESNMRKVALETGQVQMQRDLDDRYFGEGIARVENRIIQLTWRTEKAFVYSLDTFAPQGEFSYDTEGWGLTYDGQHLVMSDGSYRLYFRNPDTFAIVKTVEVYDGERPVVRLNELEYIDGMIYANVWRTDRIAIINPATGEVSAWIDLTGLLSPADTTSSADVLNGIAYDAEGDRLFVTGKLWPKLYEITLKEVDAATE